MLIICQRLNYIRPLTLIVKSSLKKLAQKPRFGGAIFYLQLLQVKNFLFQPVYY